MEYLLAGAGLLLLALGGKKPVQGQKQPPDPNANGQQGGNNVGQTVDTVVKVGGALLTTGVGVLGAVKGIVGAAGGTAGTAGTVAGGGSAAAGGTAGTTTGTAGTVTAGTDVVAAAGTAGSVSLAGALGVTAFFLLAYLIIVGPTIIGTLSENEWQRKRVRRVREGLRYIERILYYEQKTFNEMMEKIVPELNSLVVKASAAAKVPAAYPNFNAQAPSTGMAGFGAFGASTLTATNLSKLQSITTQLERTPYGFTRAYFDQAAWLGLVGDRPWTDSDVNPYYYVNSIDPRLPLQYLANGRALARYVSWVIHERMNACLWLFYGAVSQTEAEMRLWALPANEMRTVLENFYNALPETLTPAPAPGNFSALRNVAFNALQVAAMAAKGPKPDFASFDAQLNLIGTARAVAEAGTIGYEYWTFWPGDQHFAEGLMLRLGLTSEGWGISTWNWNGRPTVVAVDPTTGWGIDVVTSRNTNAPQLVPPNGIPVPVSPVAGNAVNGYNGYGRARGVASLGGLDRFGRSRGNRY